MADPGFQAMMTVAGEAQHRTTMDGLRSLVADELPAALAQTSGDKLAADELEAARQEVLDLLVMPAGAASAPEPAQATTGWEAVEDVRILIHAVAVV